MTEPVNASPAAAASATPSNQPQQPVLQTQQQYQGQTQTPDQSAQLAVTSAAQAAAAAAAAAAVAAVGNQNGLGNSNATEELVCQWEGCGDRFSTAEALYVSFYLFIHLHLFHMTPFRRLLWDRVWCL
jgi:phosphate-selective porin